VTVGAPDPPNHADPEPGNPRVSVVMIFLNGERFLDEAVQSVLAQTYSRWELLFVDDGSTDGSTAIARGYATRYPERMRYLEHPGHHNLGMSASRNLGIRQARGEYIALLDADDVYLPDKLQRQVAILDAHPEAAMVYGATCHWYGWTGRPEDQTRDHLRTLGVTPDTLHPARALVPLFLRGEAETPGTCGVLFRHTAAEAVGGFEERFRGMYEDQVFFYKLCLAAPVFVESGTSDLYRQHSASALHAAVGTGEYHSERQNFTSRRFLHWLQEHVAARGIEHSEISAHLDRELWPVTAGSPFHAPPQRRIAPVPSRGTRPPWSVMISVHDGAEHLEQALAAVLAQDSGPARMQVEVIDSRPGHGDAAEAVLRIAGSRASYVREPLEAGPAAHLNRCLERAQGHLVHLLDARDVVGEGFYGAFEQLFDHSPEIGAAFCHTAPVDGQGQRQAAPPPLQGDSGPLHPGFEKVAVLAPVERSSMVVRRAVYEHLGGFDERFAWGGYDMEMWLRIAAHYPIGYEVEPLVLRRETRDSLRDLVQCAADTIRSLAAMEAYLPWESAPALMRFEREEVALQALRDARALASWRHPIRAGSQLWDLLRTTHSFPMMMTIADHASDPVRRILRHKVRRLPKRVVGPLAARVRRGPVRTENPR
jgi:GT2 family glycosyltransferase